MAVCKNPENLKKTFILPIPENIIAYLHIFLWRKYPLDEQVRMITDHEILEVSLKIEREGHIFYKKLAQLVPGPEIKQFLDHMAAEEIRHERHFQKLFTDKGNQTYGWENRPELREMVTRLLQTDIFPEVETLENPSDQFSTIGKALDFAIESEMVSIEFYRLLGDHCHHFEAKTVLALLERAEMEHLTSLQTLKEKLGY